MAHKRKDTRVASPEWWKHLRPYNKRKLSKAERRAAKGEITEEMVKNDEPPAKLGLHNDPKVMRKLREEKGESVVPRGIYCYDEKGNCPYWDKAENVPEQNNGYCWLMGKGDWDTDMDLLWDACKSCGLKDSFAPEGTLEVVDE
jgi:hypothetical protein